MRSVSSAEEFFQKHPQWISILQRLRQLLLSAGLKETIKWGHPVYVHNGKNVVGLGAFKEFVSLWFFQGSELSDPEGKLIRAQEKTKDLRQWRFKRDEDIEDEVIVRYLEEAIHLADRQKKKKTSKAGKKKLSLEDVPQELRDYLEADVDLKENFFAFPFYKQKEFVEYIAEAKRASTRQKRAEKCIDLIRKGEGLHDRYR